MQPLSIGMKLPSRDLEKSQIEQAITGLALTVAKLKPEVAQLQSGPALDVTFLLATEADQPPFDGMQMGGYTPEDNTLYFQAAVPEGFNYSERAADYVSAVMEDVISNAIEFFAHQDVGFDALAWQRLLPKVIQREALAV